MSATHKLVVELRRDGFSGGVFSQVRNVNAPEKRGLKDPPHAVVIDRQKGRGMDSETVKHRAQALARLLRVPYDEDTSWPCIAIQGHDGCRCARCITEEPA